MGAEREERGGDNGAEGEGCRKRGCRAGGGICIPQDMLIRRARGQRLGVQGTEGGGDMGQWGRWKGGAGQGGELAYLS